MIINNLFKKEFAFIDYEQSNKFLLEQSKVCGPNAIHALWNYMLKQHETAKLVLAVPYKGMVMILGDISVNSKEYAKIANFVDKNMDMTDTLTNEKNPEQIMKIQMSTSTPTKKEKGFITNEFPNGYFVDKKNTTFTVLFDSKKVFNYVMGIIKQDYPNLKYSYEKFNEHEQKIFVSKTDFVDVWNVLKSIVYYGYFIDAAGYFIDYSLQVKNTKKEGEFRIILNTYWMLDGYKWVKKNNKIIFFGNVLKMI